jgi:HK97 family phage prohead protease
VALAEQPDVTDNTRISELRDFVRTVDPDLQRTFDFHVDEVRDSGAGGGVYTIKGHAAVYNKWSLDLGGFRERIKPGAFDKPYRRTRTSCTCGITTPPGRCRRQGRRTIRWSCAPTRQGLRFYSKVAPTSYAADLRVLLEGGVIDQSSFAFTVKSDEWRIREIDGQEIVERTINQVDQLSMSRHARWAHIRQPIPRSRSGR